MRLPKRPGVFARRGPRFISPLIEANATVKLSSHVPLHTERVHMARVVLSVSERPCGLPSAFSRAAVLSHDIASDFLSRAFAARAGR